MSDEERQRQMDFIVQRQAQTAVQLNKLIERVDALVDTVERLTGERRDGGRRQG